MRIPSGKTDILLYFVALDSSDRVTRKTGLSSFTVYRSRNGGTATVYTTPTVTELSAANMPGVYALTVDEDTTIASGSDSEEYCVHITCATMAPVTRTIELYRRDTTSGRTLDVSAGGEAGLDWANVGSPTTALALTGTTIATTQKVDVDTIKTNPVVNGGTATFPTNATLASTTNITAGTIATVTNLTNAPTAGDLTAAMKASVTTAATAATPTAAAVTGAVGSVTGAVGSVTGNVGGNVTGSVGSVTGLTASDVAAIKAKTDNLPASPAAVGSAMTLTAAYDAAKTAATQTSVDDLPTNAELTTALGTADDAVLAAIGALNNLSAAAVNAEVDTALADVGLTTTITGRIDAAVTSRLATAGYTAPANATIAAIDAKTTNLPSDPADASDIAGAFSTVNATLATIAGYIDTEVAAVKAKTDQLAFTNANELDVNVHSMNDIRLTGTGIEGTDEWRPA